MHSGADRTDQFARCMFAVHARHRLMQAALRLVLITIDANPVHHAAFGHLFGTDHRNIVLCLAGDRADLGADRSEEHTSELQSLMRISYALFCLTTKYHIS